MPLVLDEQFRRNAANKLLVQPPNSTHDVAEFQRFMKERERIAGLPADVLIRLEVLADLADQGNMTAGLMYMAEAEYFGITFPKRYMRPDL